MFVRFSHQKMKPHKAERGYIAIFKSTDFNFDSLSFCCCWVCSTTLTYGTFPLKLSIKVLGWSVIELDEHNKIIWFKIEILMELIFSLFFKIYLNITISRQKNNSDFSQVEKHFFLFNTSQCEITCERSEKVTFASLYIKNKFPCLPV